MIGIAAAVIAVAAVPVLARRGPQAGFSNASIAGTWAWSYSGRLVRYPFASIGIATFDGKGGCTISLKENSGVKQAYDHYADADSCSYKVTRGSTGTAAFSLDGEEGSISFSIGANEISFVSPDQGVVAAGVMHRRARPATKGPVGGVPFGRHDLR
jgi:hypothetical protein